MPSRAALVADQRCDACKAGQSGDAVLGKASSNPGARQTTGGAGVTETGAQSRDRTTWTDRFG
jgi:hypothetical protein